MAVVVLPRDRRLIKGKPHIVGDEKVQVPVAIVVHKAATGAPALLLTPKPGLLGQIRESAIAVIAVENVLPEAGAENIVKAVVVIVTHTNATSPTNRVQPCFFCNVRESAVTIVFVETIGGAFRCALKTRARQNENVHPPVVVVVDERAATTSRLDKVLFLLHSAVDDGGVQSCRMRNINKTGMERTAGGRGSRQWLSSVCGKALRQEPLNSEGKHSPPSHMRETAPEE